MASFIFIYFARVIGAIIFHLSLWIIIIIIII